MKTKVFLPLALYGLLLAGFGCEEKNDLINYKSEEFNTLKLDSTYQGNGNDTAQKKNVLLEDFTGVRCVNCPRAQTEAKKIQAANPERVVVSSIHVTDFAVPYPTDDTKNGSKFDFRTTDGTNLHNYLGGATSLPVGTIDRKLFGSNTSPFVYDLQWKSLVNQQLAAITPVNISFVEEAFDEAERTFKVKIKVVYTQDVSVPHYISAFINESNFTDLQLTPSGVDSSYDHVHVFRSVMQPSNGLKLADNAKKGQTFIISLTAKLPADWKAEDCTLSALVHERQDKFEVVQIQEIHIK